MIVIDVHRTRTEYLDVVRSTKGRSAPERISCESREEPHAMLVVLGASDDIIKPRTWDDYVDAIRGAVQRWIPPRAASNMAAWVRRSRSTKRAPAGPE